MVGGQPEALCSAEDRRPIEAVRRRTRPDRARLRSSAIAASDARTASGIHRGRAEGSPESPASLRSDSTLAAPPVSRLDRVRQARGDEAQATEGGDPPPVQREGAGTEMIGIG